MNDKQLDTFFAAARAPVPADEQAAERFLTGHRQRQARHQRQRRAGWFSALLATAAVVSGFTALRPAQDLPSSAAYQVYEGVAGEGW